MFFLLYFFAGLCYATGSEFHRKGHTAMNTSINIRKIAVTLFVAAIVIFFLFFIYMALCENVNIAASGRSPHHYEEVTEYTFANVGDPDAPCGLRREYRWTLPMEEASESCICFYLTDHLVHVYYDGEMVYSLEAAEGNRIGGTVGSNWITVPVHTEDAGREVTVVLTPLLSPDADPAPRFYAGSHYSIAFDVIAADLPQMFLSNLCIVLGVMIIAAQLYFVFHIQARNLDLIYLGAFAILLGLWRLSALHCAPMLFSGNPMVLGYITVGCLFLMSVPLLLFFSTFFSVKWAVWLKGLSAVYSVICIVVLILQLTGAAELQTLLPLCHGMMLFAMIFTILLALLSRRDKSAAHVSNALKLSFILMAGIVLDLVLSNLYNSPRSIVFALISFVVYSIIVFVTGIRDTTRKAYTDPRTGLTNKLRWNELLHDSAPVADGTVMLMMDLNGLKRINDTFGHEAGDIALMRFSSLLRTLFPAGSLISRWGGDEFALLLRDMNEAKLRQQLDSFAKAVEESNRLHGEPYLHYAVGHAFAADYPEMNHRQLLGKADERMYKDKRDWYAAREK